MIFFELAVATGRDDGTWGRPGTLVILYIRMRRTAVECLGHHHNIAFDLLASLAEFGFEDLANGHCAIGEGGSMTQAFRECAIIVWNEGTHFVAKWASFFTRFIDREFVGATPRQAVSRLVHTVDRWDDSEEHATLCLIFSDPDFEPMMQLRDLPNRDGFQFVGRLFDGTTRSCTIRKGRVENGEFVPDKVGGIHIIIRDDTGEPCYEQLAGVVGILTATR